MRYLLTILLLVAAMTAILELTDGTTTVDLLGNDGYVLSNWRPQIADYKDGGYWKSSSITRGRQLTGREFDNAVETIELKLKAVSQNAAIRFTQDAKRLLEDAASYWVDRWNSTPVYLKWKPSRADNAQYALVYRGRIPEEENPFGHVFQQPNCASAMDNLTLLIERDHWSENPPGEGTCVEASATRPYPYTQTTVTVTPAASSDDGYYSPTTLNTVATLVMGRFPTTLPYNTIVRFVNVNVPQGAHIISAYIRFEASATDNGKDCNLSIQLECSPVTDPPDGNCDGNSATLSTLQEALSRTWDDFGKVDWNDVEAWTADVSYDTPDLTYLAQQLIDSPHWAANGEMTFRISDNRSDSAAYRRAYSWDSWNLDNADDRPTLYIIYGTEGDYGRDETCEQEVYFSNKDNLANISHVYHYDASLASYSANLLGTYPFSIFPTTPPGNGDILYLGSQDSLAESGPFASGVFDTLGILTYTADATAIWEYWNGGWTALSVRDNTSLTYGGEEYSQAFTIAGVNSVHWVQPADWTTNDPGMGITGWWVRCRLVFNTGAITGTATQQNRDIYTITWSHIDIDEAQILGDLPALCRIRLFNESHGIPDPDLWANRIILGSRSKSRGEDFRPYINFGGEQNPTGIMVWPEGGEATFQTDATAPTGWSTLFDAGGAATQGWETRVNVKFFGRDITRQYAGRYHAWVRCKQVGGSAGQIEVRLAKSMPAGDPIVVSDEVALNTIGYIQALDMGIIELPISGMPISILPDSWFGDLLLIQAGSSSATPDLVLYDLCLLPADEWIGEFIDPSSLTNFDSSLGISEYGVQRYLDVDSISSPKHNITGVINQLAGISTYGTVRWRQITDGEIILQANADQRIYLFAERYFDASNPTWLANEPYQGYSVQVSRNARYLGMRGDR